MPSEIIQPHTRRTVSQWRYVPWIALLVGGVLSLIGLFVDQRQFGYSWLLAFMFFLSLCLGSLFLVLLHHLFDSGWSVPIRRFLEHIACLAPVMFFLWLPVGFLAGAIYPWMSSDPHTDHALHAKHHIFNKPAFYVISIGLFAIWTWLTRRLRYWSLLQDKTGAAEPTYRMRHLAAGGIFIFAVTLTLAAIFWMKSLQHQWYSTMYGVWYFAASVWVTLATTYLLTLVLQRTGPLQGLVGPRQYHDIGVLLFAFTVFYAYINFSQYFLIWNAAIPEETFWYVERERGSWWDIGMLIIFGHFAFPFLALLRIDAKLFLPLMIPMCIWAWLMHFCDLSYNIMPVLHPGGFVLHWLDLAAMAFMGGLLALCFLASFFRHAAYPVRDPRLTEALGVHPPPAAGETSVYEKVRS